MSVKISLRKKSKEQRNYKRMLRMQITGIKMHLKPPKRRKTGFKVIVTN